jgi:hypothetical protein
MRKFFSGSYLLFEVLALAFIVFTSWYDGWWISPLTPKDGQVLFEALNGSRGENQVSQTVNRQSVEEFVRTDDGRPFYMVNILKYKPIENSDSTALNEAATGVDERYASVVFPLLLKRASHPVLVASPLRTFSEPSIDEAWDDIFIMRYRSRRDLFEIVTSEVFQEAWVHKLDSVEKTVVIPSSPILPGLSLKWIFGLVLLVIGWVGHKLVQRRRKQSES